MPDFSQKKEGVMSGLELVTCVIGSCCYRFDPWGAAVSPERGEPTLNSTCFRPHVHPGVLDVSARDMFELPPHL